MSVRASVRRKPGGAAFLAVVVLAAGAAGLLASFSPTLAVAGIVGAVAVRGALLRPKVVPHILVVTVFAEALTVGGVTVGRLVAPLAMIALLSQLVTARVRLPEVHATLLFVGAYVTLALASLIWTVSASYSLFALASLAIALVYLGGFALLVEDRNDLRRLLWTVTLSSVALGVWWIGSFAAGVDRFQTGAGDPNFLAAFQATALPVAIALAANSRDALARIGLYFAAGIIAASVIATLSRGGSLTLLAEVLALAVVPSRALFRSRPRKISFFALTGVALAVLLVLAGGTLRQRFLIGFQQRSPVGSRGDLWAAAWHGYHEHPVLGLGYGGFKAVSFQLLSRTPGVNLAFHETFRLRNGEYVHNAYLGTLAELGPIGLILFGGILASTGRSFFLTARRARNADDPFMRSAAIALLVGLLAFSVASFSLSSESSRALWFLIGLSICLPRLELVGAGRPPVAAGDRTSWTG